MCTETARTCEAVFDTKGKTCSSHCESLGLVCEEGWDEQDGNCDSKILGRAGNGCSRPYQTQICRCAAEYGISIRIAYDQNIVHSDVRPALLIQKIC